jgi:acyl carrier protein
MADQNVIREKLKGLIIESLNLEGMTPEMIDNEAPLFGEGLGLDSVDALELVVALEKEFSVRIEGEETTREAFASVSAMAKFIDSLTGSAGAQA